MPRVDIEHQESVALGPEDDLLVREPCRAEDLAKPGAAVHWVLLEHRVGEHVPRSVLAVHSHGTEPLAETHLPVEQTFYKVARNIGRGYLSCYRVITVLVRIRVVEKVLRFIVIGTLDIVLSVATFTGNNFTTGRS